MNIFYSNTIQNEFIVLPDDEARHCTKVLRKTVGDDIYVIDGNGNLHKAQLTSISSKHVVAKIIKTTQQYGCHPYYIRMIVAPPKNIDRFEFFIEKAVEIGVNEIIPIITTHSERKQIKVKRLERIMISAMKQSYKAQKPIIHDLQAFTKVVKTDFSGIKCIAHCKADATKTLKQYNQPKEISIIIGPEGDFSPEEIAMAETHNWQTISLGASRLRTETAALVAVQSVQFLWL